MFDNTRAQILNRLWLILSNPALARMFSHEKNAVDMFASMNNGSLILINTAKDFLQPSGCQLLGTFFIALIAQATQERASLAPEQRKPTMLYIDEAHDYFADSSMLETLFVSARKYKVGLTIATQSLVQFDRRLVEIVMTNAATKIVGGLSAKDASVFAAEMQCKPELLLQFATKTKSQATFAAYSKNVVPGAPGGMTVPFGLMDREPKLTKEEFNTLSAGKTNNPFCNYLHNTIF
jgi:hypothetical protein